LRRCGEAAFAVWQRRQGLAGLCVYIAGKGFGVNIGPRLSCAEPRETINFAAVKGDSIIRYGFI